jgi:hypothetical protein
MSNFINLVSIKLNPKSLGPGLDWTSKENDYLKEIFLLIVCQIWLELAKIKIFSNCFKTFFDVFNGRILNPRIFSSN